MQSSSDAILLYHEKQVQRLLAREKQDDDRTQRKQKGLSVLSELPAGCLSLWCTLPKHFAARTIL